MFVKTAMGGEESPEKKQQLLRIRLVILATWPDQRIKGNKPMSWARKAWWNLFRQGEVAAMDSMDDKTLITTCGVHLDADGAVTIEEPGLVPAPEPVPAAQEGKIVKAQLRMGVMNYLFRHRDALRQELLAEGHTVTEDLLRERARQKFHTMEELELEEPYLTPRKAGPKFRNSKGRFVQPGQVLHSEEHEQEEHISHIKHIKMQL